MSIFENFNKKIWLAFFILYVIILYRYFASNNIPIQLDTNILILVVVFLFFILLIIGSLYVFAGAIERAFMLVKKTNKESIIFKNFDFNVLMTVLPTFGIILLVKQNEENIILFTYFFVFLFFYIPILLLLSLKFKMKKFLYTNSIILPAICFYKIFEDTGMTSVSIIFLIFSGILLFLYIKDNEEYINKKFDLNLDDSYLYSYLKEEFLLKTKNPLIKNFKIDLVTLLIGFSIIFFIWDMFISQNKVNNFLTCAVLKLTKIGCYTTSLTIKKNLLTEFEKDAYDINDKNFTIDVEVIWENNNDIYIKYLNQSIKIHQEYIVMNKYINIKQNKNIKKVENSTDK